jgi:hypothetical protein
MLYKGKRMFSQEAFLSSYEEQHEINAAKN